MFSPKLNHLLNLTPELEVNVVELVKFIKVQNKFQFNIDEFYCNSQALIDKDLLRKKDNNGKLAINENSEILAYVFLDAILQEDRFLISNNFTETLKYIDDLEDTYEEKGLKFGWFKGYFIKFLLIHTNELFQSDFSDFINLDNEALKSVRFEFADIFINSLIHLDIRSSLTLQHLEVLLELLKGDGTYNIFLKDLKKYSLSQPSKSFELFEHFLVSTQ